MPTCSHLGRILPCRPAPPTNWPETATPAAEQQGEGGPGCRLADTLVTLVSSLCYACHAQHDVMPAFANYVFTHAMQELPGRHWHGTTHLAVQLCDFEPVPGCHCLPLAVNELLKLHEGDTNTHSTQSLALFASDCSSKHNGRLTAWHEGATSEGRPAARTACHRWSGRFNR